MGRVSLAQTWRNFPTKFDRVPSQESVCGQLVLCCVLGHPNLILSMTWPSAHGGPRPLLYWPRCPQRLLLRLGRRRYRHLVNGLIFFGAVRS